MRTELETYLQYYSSLENPGYAVLVKGAWGVGKTFQVKRAIGQDQFHVDRYWLVSLFGLQTASEVTTAIFAAMFPGAARGKKVAESLSGAGILGWSFGAAPALVAAAIREKAATDRVLILDDFERCTVPIADLLGIINRYVETHGCRVVVIAHDEKIEKSIEERKEKVFGHTVEATPDVTAGFQAFALQLNQSPGDEDRILGRYQNAICEEFDRSDVRSLRILRHVMEDCLRVWKALDDRMKSNEIAMDALLRSLTALNCHVRSGKLKPMDFATRVTAHFRGAHRRDNARQTFSEDASPPAEDRMADVVARHAEAHITGDHLDDNALVRFFFDGMVDCERFNRALSRSAFFRTASEMPPWRRIYEFRALDDKTVRQAVEELAEQIVQRAVLPAGETKHVLALWLLLAKVGETQRSLPQAVQDCLDYIADQMRRDQLPAPDFDAFPDVGYEGIGYWTFGQEQEVAAVFLEFDRSRLEQAHSRLKIEAQDILELVEHQPDNLFSVLNWTSEGRGRFQSLPILTAVDPAEFVLRWLRASPASWLTMSLALKERASHGRNLAEQPWMRQVRDLLQEEAQRRGGLRGFALQNCADNINANLSAE